MWGVGVNSGIISLVNIKFKFGRFVLGWSTSRPPWSGFEPVWSQWWAASEFKNIKKERKKERDKPREIKIKRE